LTERNCTIKLENWLKYYNSSNVQLQIKLQVQIVWKQSRSIQTEQACSVWIDLLCFLARSVIQHADGKL